MAFYLECGFDLNVIGAMQAKLTEAAGGGAQTVTVTAASYCFTDISAVSSTSGYTGFAAALESALETASANAHGYTVTYTQTTGTFNVKEATGSLNFTLKQAIGFATNVTGASSYDSTLRSYYYILGATGARSDVSDDYEPGQLAEGAETDDGGHFSVSRAGSPTYHDFMLFGEAHAATHQHSATVSVPWTWEHFFKHARSSEPFLAKDDNESLVLFLRPEFCHFRPDVAVKDWADLWHIKLNCYLEGRL